jgi:hypothetical protein
MFLLRIILFPSLLSQKSIGKLINVTAVDEENRRRHNAWEKREAIDMIGPSKLQLTMHQKRNTETVGSSCVTAGSSSCVCRR